jgi:outer membrane protein insertion porin family
MVSEIEGVDAADFERLLRVRPGSTFTPVVLEANIARLERLASDRGLSFARVEPRITRNDAALTLDVEFALVRGPRVFVERIDIEGNATTRDEVIRRQFRIAEGDPFNPREIREAAERIRALGYFAEANVETREGAGPDQVIVDVDVEETTTGTLGFGVTYSVDAGAGFALTFQETNFLGRGQILDFALSTGTSNQDTSIRFVEPAFLPIKPMLDPFGWGYSRLPSWSFAATDFADRRGPEDTRYAPPTL